MATVAANPLGSSTSGSKDITTPSAKPTDRSKLASIDPRHSCRPTTTSIVAHKGAALQVGSWPYSSTVPLTQVTVPPPTQT